MTCTEIDADLTPARYVWLPDEQVLVWNRDLPPAARAMIRARLFTAERG